MTNSVNINIDYQQRLHPLNSTRRLKVIHTTEVQVTFRTKPIEKLTIKVQTFGAGRLKVVSSEGTPTNWEDVP